jgi:hypothetical protein
VQRPDGASVDLCVKPSDLLAEYSKIASAVDDGIVWRLFKLGEAEPLSKQRPDICEGDVLFALPDKAHPLEWSQDEEDEIKGLEEAELKALFWRYREAERVTKKVFRF